MLIGEDDINNEAITHCFALIGGNLTAQSTGNHRRIGGRIQVPET